MKKSKKLRLNHEHGIIFGVCAGIAERFNIEPWIVRILFILLPHTALTYVIMALCLVE